MASNPSSGDKQVQSAVLQEALFRPRNTLILAITALLAFIVPSYWWLVAAIGISVWLFAVIETMRSSTVRAKALAFVIAGNLTSEQAAYEPGAEEIEIVLETLVATIGDKVPEDVLVRVESIKASILKILPQIANIDSSDYNIYVVRKIALDYLPETLENYLKLPTDLATLQPIKDGKTAQQLLLEQLGLLDTELKSVIEDLHDNDTQSLLAHGRFLNEKFGKSDLWLGNGV